MIWRMSGRADRIGRALSANWPPVTCVTGSLHPETTTRSPFSIQLEPKPSEAHPI
jgi:hypothetical protein